MARLLPTPKLLQQTLTPMKVCRATCQPGQLDIHNPAPSPPTRGIDHLSSAAPFGLQLTGGNRRDEAYWAVEMVPTIIVTQGQLNRPRGN